MNKLSKFFISAAIAGTVITAGSAAQAQTLKQGSTGYNVRIIQTELRNRGHFPSNLPSTGYYGSITRKAVMDFQRMNGLRMTGIADATTLRAMGYFAEGGSAPSTAVSYGTSGIVRVRSNLNVRTGPGTGYKVIGTLEPGQNIRISNQRNGWYNIHPEGQNYWVHSKYIQVQ